MKILSITFKDILRSYRSTFLLVMMFALPLLLTGLIYFAFSGIAKEQGNFNLPLTHLQIVNLDQSNTRNGFAAGQILSDYLQGETLKDLLQVTLAANEAGARTAVEKGEVDVALIIPVNFTAAVEIPDQSATVTLYHDPTKTVAPRIVRIVLGEFLDGFSGAKIAVEVTSHQLKAQGLSLDSKTAANVAQAYVTWVQGIGHGHNSETSSAPLSVRLPVTAAQTTNPQTTFLGPVMAGMMIFFVFFTGAATAQSIIYEDEEGTLARLFTTPTSRARILGGKLLAILVTLVVQTIVLILASSILFDIHWGSAPVIAVVIFGLILVAASFGIFLMSFIKTARQAGPIMGAMLTVTGMMGGLFPMGDPSQPSPIEAVTRFMPQGWAMRGLKLALTGASVEQVLLPTLVLFIISLVLFSIGVIMFRKRFQ